MQALRRLLAIAALASSLHLAQPIPALAQAGKITNATPDDASKIDLNSATPDQLKAIPGIGDAYAKRIVDGRPYTAKTQLTTKGILPQATYDKIKDMVVARRPAKK